MKHAMHKPKKGKAKMPMHNPMMDMAEMREAMRRAPVQKSRHINPAKKRKKGK